MRTKTELLEGADTNTLVNSRIIGNNTLAMEYSDRKAVRLHNTDVVTFKNGHIILNSGGWLTPTTKDRINEHQNVVRVDQRKSVWYCTTAVETDLPYYDGIIFDLDGRLVSERK